MPSRRTLLTTAMASAVTAAFAVPTAAQAQSYAAYAMVYFKESPNLTDDSYALHLAVSGDGLEWTPLNQNQPVATPTEGMLGLRDPFLLRKQDGTFVALATDLKGRVFHLNNQYIHVWDSTDLRSFTGYRRVKLHDLATHSWAPTAFWDPSRNRVRGRLLSEQRHPRRLHGQLHDRLREHGRRGGVLRPRIQRAGRGRLAP